MVTTRSWSHGPALCMICNVATNTQRMYVRCQGWMIGCVCRGGGAGLGDNGLD